MAYINLQVLASGSKGNAILVWTDNTCVLVDAGLSGQGIAERMRTSPVLATDIQAIVVSHEHIDHVRGVGVLSRKYNLPVYLSSGTLTCLPVSVGKIKNHYIFRRGVPFRIGDIDFKPFMISHDAEEPTGFVISSNGIQIGLCTDLGVVTELVKVHLKECHVVVLEANHDVELLMNGPYPWYLKQRIRGRMGHLSNEESFDLCKEIYHCELHALCFGHLSEVNNSHERVLRHIEALRMDTRWNGVKTLIASQYGPCEAISL